MSSKKLEIQFGSLKKTECEPTNPETIARQKELAKTIKRMLNKLSPKERLVVIMCVMDEKTQKEAAEFLGVTEKKVAGLKQKAMSKLRHPLNSHSLRSCL